MRRIILSLTMFFLLTSMYAGELQTGSHNAQALMDSGIPTVKPYNSARKICLIQDQNQECVKIPGARLISKLTFTMPQNSLNKYYLLSVTARADSTWAQIMLSENFRWGSSDKVGRYIRRRLRSDSHYAAYTVPFQVKALPFYINFGILHDDKSIFHLREAHLEEITPEQYSSYEKNQEEYVPASQECMADRYRKARTRLLKSTAAAAANRNFSPALRAYAEGLHQQAAALKIGSRELRHGHADKIISSCERIVIQKDNLLNPAEAEARNGVIRLNLYNLHSDHSVWARIEADDSSLEYRMITPDGTGCLLNEADVISLPAGEKMLLEIKGVRRDTRLSVYPLDHFGSTSWNRLTITSGSTGTTGR